jgi:hypothetical protein
MALERRAGWVVIFVFFATTTTPSSIYFEEVSNASKLIGRISSHFIAARDNGIL